MMKKGSTLFLKLALFVIGTPVLALCIYGVFDLIKHPANPEYALILYPIVAGLYLSTVPFYMALVQAFQLLNHIDQSKAFSEVSVKALKIIKRCAIIISVVYLILEPFFFQLAERDDAPGLVIIGMIPVFASIIIAVFAAVLERLLKEAIEFKSENDLTV